MNKIRNGEVDLLRFVFAMTIVMYHISIFFNLNYYRSGGVGVEFFFIVTGFLMAQTGYSRIGQSNSISNDTYNFIKRKILSFYPYYIVALLIQFTIIICLIEKNTLTVAMGRLVYGIPNFLLLQNSGIEYSGGLDIGGSWFLSAMILALIFVYPLLLQFGDKAIYILFAIIGIFGFGMNNNGQILELGSYSIYASRMLRAISEISLGAWGFGLAKKFDELKLTKISKIFLTVIKIFCFYEAIGCGFYGLDGGYSSLATILCFFGIILSFSNKTFILHGNKITTSIGKLSLVIYVTHFIVISVAIKLFGTDINGYQIALIICSCICFAYCVMIATDKIKKQIVKIRRIFILDNMY
jgi:peptidoglycan/LPS O-acetylase OafA/YrhL